MSQKTPLQLIQDLIEKFDKSGQTEMSALVEICQDHLSNEMSEKVEPDEDSLDLLDSIFTESIRAANALRRDLRNQRRKNTKKEKP